MTYLYYKAINWNETEDQVDQVTWEKYTSHFWLDTRIPISEDRLVWQELSDEEQKQFQDSIGRLALLATLQSEYGLPQIRSGIRSQQEEAILNNMTFMTSVHAKSYSTILITLGHSVQRIDRLFAKIEAEREVKHLLGLLQAVYVQGTALQKRITALYIQGFLTYASLFTILQFENQAKLENIAKLLHLIIRDNSAYTNYLAYKFKLSFEELSKIEQSDLQNWLKEFSRACLHDALKDAESIYADKRTLSQVKDLLAYGLYQQLEQLGLGGLGAEIAGDVTWESLAPFLKEGLTQSGADVTFSPQMISVQASHEAMSDDDYDF